MHAWLRMLALASGGSSMRVETTPELDIGGKQCVRSAHITAACLQCCGRCAWYADRYFWPRH